MQYFTDKEDFYIKPISFDKNTPKEILKNAIGANMYMPGTKDIFDKLVNNEFKNVGAITLCCEDAIKESEVLQAEENIICLLNKLYDESLVDKDNVLNQKLPLLFIRVRNVLQFKNITSKMNSKTVKFLTGFCFPKFNSQNAFDYMKHLTACSVKYNTILYGMPILEDATIIYKESRNNELIKLKTIFDDYEDYILNIRIGGTDFSSLFGLRRSLGYTIYDLQIIKDCICDILNFFGRSDNDFVVSAAVYEYFSTDSQSVEIQTLQKETLLDIENGFQGKTVIHPSQINPVNECYIVSYSDYMDAKNILSKEGVFKSYNNNKMNEVAPHTNWAKKIISRAEVFGVVKN